MHQGDGDIRELTSEEGPARGIRTWDMAGAKTFDLLVGVVLVLHCVEHYADEITTTSNGKDLFSQSGPAQMRSVCKRCRIKKTKK